MQPKFLRAIKTLIVFRPEILLQDYYVKNVQLFLYTIIYIAIEFVKYYLLSFKCFLIFNEYLCIHTPFNTFKIVPLGQIPKSEINGQRARIFYFDTI